MARAAVRQRYPDASPRERYLRLAGGTPLDAQQPARRLTVSVDSGVLPIHPPEDILLQKLHWFSAGGELSDRQWRDVLAIVRVQGTNLDTDYLRANAPIFGVEICSRGFSRSVLPPVSPPPLLFSFVPPHPASARRASREP